MRFSVLRFKRVYTALQLWIVFIQMRIWNISHIWMFTLWKIIDEIHSFNVSSASKHINLESMAIFAICFSFPVIWYHLERIFEFTKRSDFKKETTKLSRCCLKCQVDLILLCLETCKIISLETRQWASNNKFYTQFRFNE